MNKVFTPKPGDVYVSNSGIYRMYVEVLNKKELLCIKLCDGRSYPHIEDNGLVDPKQETFVFNMADLVTSNS
jgi:hypothetical protein